MVDNEAFFGGNKRNLGVPRVGVIITDGHSGDDVLDPANRARENEITLFAVGVGGYDIDELNEIANDPDDVHRFEVPNFQTIENIRNTLVLSTCLGNETFSCYKIFNHAMLDCLLPPGYFYVITAL